MSSLENTMKPTRGMALTALLLAVTSLGAQAQGKAYKCRIDGRTVFQQAACPVNAEPEPIKAELEPVVAQASSPAPAASRSGAKVRSTKPAASAAAR
jgi:hypothetical protein